jgi:hypothetical protein
MKPERLKALNEKLFQILSLSTARKYILKWEFK